jgi:tRNA G46 methylase TrmB
MEMALDVFGQGVNLKGKVLTVHGVQHIKTDGEFLAEACMNAVAQKLTRVHIDKVERRSFHNTGTEIQQ